MIQTASWCQYLVKVWAETGQQCPAAGAPDAHAGECAGTSGHSPDAQFYARDFVFVDKRVHCLLDCFLFIFVFVLLAPVLHPCQHNKHKLQHVQDGIRRTNQEVNHIGTNHNDPDGVLVPISGQGLGRGRWSS